MNSNDMKKEAHALFPSLMKSHLVEDFCIKQWLLQACTLERFRGFIRVPPPAPFNPHLQVYLVSIVSLLVLQDPFWVAIGSNPLFSPSWPPQKKSMGKSFIQWHKSCLEPSELAWARLLIILHSNIKDKEEGICLCYFWKSEKDRCILFESFPFVLKRSVCEISILKV